MHGMSLCGACHVFLHRKVLVIFTGKFGVFLMATYAKFCIFVLKHSGMVSMSQTFKLYEMVNKYLKNNEDAKAVVLGIEGIINEKFESEKDRLATKEDLRQLQLATKDDLRQLQIATKVDLTKEISRLETKMEQGFKEQLKWLIILMFTFSGSIIALLKLT